MSGKYQIRKLGSADQGQWDGFVESSPQGCIFCKAWWLDAVAPGQYQLIGLFDNGTLIGGLPLIKSKNTSGSYGMPPLTQTLGVLLSEIKGKYVKQISESKRITEALVGILEDSSYFSNNFHANFTNWLPFMWAGYSQTTRYTYVIDGLSDEKEIWAGFAKNIKGDIKKAEKANLLVRTDLADQLRFWKTYEKTFYRQGMSTPVSFEFFTRLDNMLSLRNKRQIFFVEDPQGNDHAVVYLVWDMGCAYYLMGGADPELRSSGATSYGLWAAIRFAAGVAERFDFEGSVVKSIERHFRAFGGSQVPYFQIRRTVSKTSRLKSKLKEIVQNKLHFTQSP